MLVTNADKIRGKLAIKIVIGSEDGLLKWTEQLHTSMVTLKISHELEIVWRRCGTISVRQTRAFMNISCAELRYAADSISLCHSSSPASPQLELGATIHARTSRLLRD